MMPQTERSGFTLIELLASMAILVLLMLALSRLYTETSAAWSLAHRRAEMNTTGRAVMQLMTRDVSAAVADDVLRLTQNARYRVALGLESDSIAFVALNQSVDSSRRTAHELAYYLAPTRLYNASTGRFENELNRYRLMRSRKARLAAVTAYTNDNWNVGHLTQGGIYNLDFGEEVVENIRTLEIYVYDEQQRLIGNFDSESNGWPLWIDIYLEMLGEADARRVQDLAPAGGTVPPSHPSVAFADRAVKRYVSRVYFPNRFGYTLGSYPHNL
jgi:prepilin-type N-terminal cleavage/methylation domain-containing protein